MSFLGLLLFFIMKGRKAEPVKTIEWFRIDLERACVLPEVQGMETI